MSTVCIHMFILSIYTCTLVPSLIYCMYTVHVASLMPDWKHLLSLPHFTFHTACIHTSIPSTYIYIYSLVPSLIYCMYTVHVASLMPDWKHLLSLPHFTLHTACIHTSIPSTYIYIYIFSSTFLDLLHVHCTCS